MSKMVLERVVVLSLLVTQALSAPSGCTESCTSYLRQYQTQASGGYHDLSGLAQVGTQLQDVNYLKPGNWTEHNEYRTDGGHGKVHEERGQYVEGPKQVRYYKKNYTSSYSAGYANGAGISEAEQNSNYRQSVHVPESQMIIDSQRTYNQMSDLESIRRQQEYERIENERRIQLANRRTHIQSERLEDLGEYSGNSQATQQGTSVIQFETEPGTWRRVHSHKTDGGNGRVFEEEGQYVAGPKKVHYYKRNSTSSYSSIGGVPTTDITATGVQDLHKELEKLHREITKDFHHISTVGSTAATNIGHANIDTLNLGHDNVQTVASDSYRRRVGQHDAVDMMAGASEHIPLVNPTQRVYGERHSYERHEGWSSKPQYIVPTPGYTNVLVTGGSTYNRDSLHRGSTEQHGVDDLQQTEVFDTQQSKLIQDELSSGNIRHNTYNQNIATLPTTGQVGHYKEHWSSSSHTRESSLPQVATDSLHLSEQSARYHQYENRHRTYDSAEGSERYDGQRRDGNYNHGYRTTSGRLTTGMVDGGHDTVDCDHGVVEQVQYGTRYHRNYKRDTKYDELSDLQQHQTEDLTQQHQNTESDDLVQQTNKFGDLQQTMGKLEFGQQTQQHDDDLSQQTGKLEFGQQTQQHDDDLTQQTGKLEFGQQTQQHDDDLTQQTGKLEFGQQTQQHDDDLTQQTGKLEFGQQAQHPWKPSTGNQHMEDLTQQNEDLTQTTGKLEFGQQTQHPYPTRHPATGNQELEDLTQQTNHGFDDLTQQTGKLEFGQQSQHPYPTRHPGTGNQELEDLTQQTNNGFDDLTQQTGKIEFGQQSQHPYPTRRPGTGNQHIEDLSQQTNQFDDFTQQTGKIEFGQQSQRPYPTRRPGIGNQHQEDLTQQTSNDFDDFTQQPGKLEFGQQSQRPYPTRHPGTGNQELEDLTQQTNNGFDDLTQQTGKLEFGQHSQRPYPTRRPGTGNQHMEDLSQQTNNGFDDLTQQTGTLEFGQQSQHPYPTTRPGTGNQHMEDLSQQTNHGFDDLTQQTGKIEFGQQSQHPYPTRRPGTGNQHIEDLSQQTNQFDDFTQQTGKIEFGQQSQYPYPTRRPSTGNQHLEDLTQQTNNGFDDLTQQTGKLEFGQQSQDSWRPDSQHVDDFNQQMGKLDDLTQQTSGKLEFGQQSQHSVPSWYRNTANQHSQDLTQQTDAFGALSQQTGKLEFGQEPQKYYQPWRPSTSSQHVEDLTQQNEDLTQQVGKMEFNPYLQNPYKPGRPTGHQYPEDLSQTNEDFTQQTGGFDDMSVHSGKLEFGQQTQHTSGGQHDDSLQQNNKYDWNHRYPVSDSWQREDLTQQTGTNSFDSKPHFDQQQNVGVPVEQHDTSAPKPAQKPRPRPRYTRIQTVPSHEGPESDVHQQNSHSDTGDVSIADIHEGSSKVNGEVDIDNVRSEKIRGDQGLSNPTDKSKGTNPHSLDMGRGNSDQVNWLHKTNDATVGLQWHYTYHPSDLTNSEPAQDNYYSGSRHNSGVQQKERPFDHQTDVDQDSQQQTKPVDFNINQEQNGHKFGSVYQQSGQTSFDQQDVQNKETFGNTYQQSNEKLSHVQDSKFDQQSGSEEPTYAFGQRVESTPNVGKPQSQTGQQEVPYATKGGSRRRNRPTTPAPTEIDEQNNKQVHKLEPRILEAYGGGPYEVGHSDDIYTGVTVNPSATLPPINSVDPWDVREKPREMFPLNNEYVTVQEPMETTTLMIETTTGESTETPPPSFWGKLGSKITNTFDKAKEKARGIFG